MEAVQLLRDNLLSPMALAFALGVCAALLRSDLRVPEQVHSALSMYLLLAIGLKGGVALGKTDPADLWAPALGTLLLGAATLAISYGALRRLGRLDRPNAAALAAHYGSVSAVTFIAALEFASAAGQPAEGFMPALVALLEVPAIIGAIWIANGARRGGLASIRPVLTGKCVVLLVGGMVMGALAGDGFTAVAPVFQAAFPGALVFFLLEMGVLAGQQLGQVRKAGLFVPVFAICMPIVGGALGVLVAKLSGLSLGGASVLGAMAASASYIAAPAAVRTAIPEAKPSLYLTAALGITFPFNILVGIPLYHEFATLLFRR